jgi:hypothetical protein
VEIVLFTVVGIVLYLVTTQVLILLEKIHGDPLPQRNIVFFVIILALSVPSFALLRTLLGEGESAQDNYQEQQATDRGYQPPQPH